MTNNNWEEEFWAKVKFYNLSLDNENYDDLMKFTKFFITKKDQEHKAELDNLYSNIEDLKKRRKSARSHTDGLDESEISYNIGIEDTLAILDSHINKQNI